MPEMRQKEAVVHVVCMVNNKQIDKWLCADCAEKLMPYAVSGGGRAVDPRNLLETLFFGGEQAKPQERRFTKRMASILENAMRSALDRGHDHLGTEHLLLALLNEKDCYGVRVLEKLGINPVAVAEEVEKPWTRQAICRLSSAIRRVPNARLKLLPKPHWP